MPKQLWLYTYKLGNAVRKNWRVNRAIYENLLSSMTRPNQAWSSDITYIWTVEGWLYLAAER